MNLVILIGNLVKDPEMRYTQAGKAITTFRLATPNRYRAEDDSGNENPPDFHNVVIWGIAKDKDGAAGAAAQYLKKGSKVCVRGRVTEETWTDDKEVKHWKTMIVADTYGGIEFMDSKRGAAEPESSTAGQ